MLKEILLKKILYKSSNRGWKENDILLGEFTKENAHLMNEDQLKKLDQLLDQSDVDLFSWITKKTSVPKNIDNEVMTMLQKYQYKSFS